MPLCNQTPSSLEAHKAQPSLEHAPSRHHASLTPFLAEPPACFTFEYSCYFSNGVQLISLSIRYQEFCKSPTQTQIAGNTSELFSPDSTLLLLVALKQERLPSEIPPTTFRLSGASTSFLDGFPKRNFLFAVMSSHCSQIRLFARPALFSVAGKKVTKTNSGRKSCFCLPVTVHY